MESRKEQNKPRTNRKLTPKPPDFTQKTTLAFNPADETFKITRPSFTTSASTSSSETNNPSPSSNLINTLPEIAPHTLFTTTRRSTTPTTTNTNKPTQEEIREGKEETEPLHIRAFRDSSVLEVFVNGGRTAISTRLYAAEENLGVRFWVEEEEDDDDDGEGDGKSELIHADIWDGIGV